MSNIIKINKKLAKKEFRKCKKNPVYFINKYVKISHPILGRIDFDLYDFQEDLIDTIKDNRLVIVLKGRQLGISTVQAAYNLWLMLFHREKRIACISTKQKMAAAIVEKTRYAFENLPAWLRMMYKVVKNNVNSFKIDNGSSIEAVSTSGDKIARGLSATFLVIDEAAFIDKLDEFYAAIQPIISTGGSCIALSTPNGVGNWFHKTYVAATEGENNFVPVELPWHVHPDRGPGWLDEQRSSGMSPQQVAQEHECNFLTSGRTVINPADLERIQTEELITQEHLFERVGVMRDVHIYERHDPGCSYLMTADVARGDGEDYSAFIIFNLETMEQVAEYRGKLPPDEFSVKLYDFGKEYGNALLVVENNNIGSTVCRNLEKMEYPNLYYQERATGDFVDSNMAYGRSDVLAGFTTTSKNRDRVINKMEEFIRNKKVTIRSERLYNELLTFVWNISARTGRGKAEALKNRNDDLTMCLAIACYVADIALEIDKRSQEYDLAFFAGIKSSKAPLSPKTNGKSRSGINSISGFDSVTFNISFGPPKKSSKRKGRVIRNKPWLIKK